MADTRAPHIHTRLESPNEHFICHRYCRHINGIRKNDMRGTQISQKSRAISKFYAPEVRHEASYTLRTDKY